MSATTHSRAADGCFFQCSPAVWLTRLCCSGFLWRQCEPHSDLEEDLLRTWLSFCLWLRHLYRCMPTCSMLTHARGHGQLVPCCIVCWTACQLLFNKCMVSHFACCSSSMLHISGLLFLPLMLCRIKHHCTACSSCMPHLASFVQIKLACVS